MMEQIILFPVLTALCLLISLIIAILTERNETREKIHPILKKVSWNTFFKLIVFWGGILVLRKLLYYLPIDGVIQTKNTVWWIEKKDSFYLFIFMFILLMMALRRMISRLKLPGKNFNKFMKSYGSILIVFLIYLVGLLGETNLFSPILSFINKLLLSLKIVCPGKYLGLVTGFFLAYYITRAYKIFRVPGGINKKLKKGKTLGKAVRVPLLLLIIGLFTYLTIPSGPSAWMSELLTRLRHARIQQQEEAFDDLLDAANYMRDRVKKSQALGEIAVAIRQAGDMQRARKILEQAANEIARLQDWTMQFNAFRYLALILKDSGDNSNAKQMYKKAVEAVEWIEDNDEISNALLKVTWDIVIIGDIKWGKDILLWTIDAAESVRPDSAKAKLFKNIARMISRIPDIETKDIMLSAIQQKM
jgi:tetratricopeptide (TPR) repeat protein